MWDDTLLQKIDTGGKDGPRGLVWDMGAPGDTLLILSRPI